MPVTSIYGLRYQALSDPPDGAALGQNLAEDVETELVRVDAAATTAAANITALQGLGYIGEDLEAATPAASTGVEVFSVTVTWTAVSSYRYKFTWDGTWFSTVLGDVARLRIRYKAGASVDSAGTELRIVSIRAEVANSGQSGALHGTVTGLSGQYTVGVSVQRVADAGSFTISGSATDQSYLLVERIK